MQLDELINGTNLELFWKWYLLPTNQKSFKTIGMMGGDNAKKIRFMAQSIYEWCGVLCDYYSTLGYDLVVKREYNPHQQIFEDWYYNIIIGVEEVRTKHYFVYSSRRIDAYQEGFIHLNKLVNDKDKLINN